MNNDWACETPDGWTWSADPTDPWTRQRAIENGRCGGQEFRVCQIARGWPPDLTPIHADCLLDSLRDDVWERNPEWRCESEDGPRFDSTPEQEEDLDKMIAVVFTEWLRKHKIETGIVRLVGVPEVVS